MPFFGLDAVLYSGQKTIDTKPPTIRIDLVSEARFLTSGGSFATARIGVCRISFIPIHPLLFRAVVKWDDQRDRDRSFGRGDR